MLVDTAAEVATVVTPVDTIVMSADTVADWAVLVATAAVPTLEDTVVTESHLAEVTEDPLSH